MDRGPCTIKCTQMERKNCLQTQRLITRCRQWSWQRYRWKGKKELHQDWHCRINNPRQTLTVIQMETIQTAGLTHIRHCVADTDHGKKKKSWRLDFRISFMNYDKAMMLSPPLNTAFWPALCHSRNLLFFPVCNPPPPPPASFSDAEPCVCTVQSLSADQYHH